MFVLGEQNQSPILVRKLLRMTCEAPDHPEYDIHMYKHIVLYHNPLLFSFTEAQYAFQTNTLTIPLKVEENFEPKGWLGLLMGTALYYQAHTDEMLEKNFADIIKELGDKGKATKDG